MIVSIIIAVATWQENLAKCVEECQGLEYPDFEIILLPDAPLARSFDSPRIRVIPTGKVGPAAKRDKALPFARGQILAFIDDDAYPRKDWLKNAVPNFSEEQVAAVGGPAVTPCEDSPLQLISGLIYESPLVSGNFTYRYLPKQKQLVVDFPSCNFLVRASVMKELGGFNTEFWPGEDTKLCLDITVRLGKKIIYDPAVLVYHHRRKYLSGHLRQIASYALHRGFFVKRFPQTSFKIPYFLPSLLVLFMLAGGSIALFSDAWREVYLAVVSLYLLTVFIFNSINMLKKKVLPATLAKKASLISSVFAGIISTHLAYGIYFLKGLILPKLKEEA